MPALPLVELRDVTVRFGAHVALERVSFRVEEGQFTAIIGPNGAGKTTLLRVILGILRPEEGEVRVLGKPPWKLTRKERLDLGYVPQEFPRHRHFPLRVMDVVLMGRYGALGWFRRPGADDRRRALEILKLLEIDHLAHRRLAELSGGERQRAFIARALINRPRLLLLDEPSASLDPAMTEGLFALLRRLQKELGLTVLLVSHDVGIVASFADRVACLARRLVAHGRPQEVLTEANLECMYGRHAAAVGHGQLPHIVLPLSEHEKTFRNDQERRP